MDHSKTKRQIAIATLLMLVAGVSSAQSWKGANERAKRSCTVQLLKPYEELDNSDIQKCGAELMKYAQCAPIVEQATKAQLKADPDLFAMYLDCSDFMVKMGMKSQ